MKMTKDSLFFSEVLIHKTHDARKLFGVWCFSVQYLENLKQAWSFIPYCYHQMKKLIPKKIHRNGFQIELVITDGSYKKMFNFNFKNSRFKYEIKHTKIFFSSYEYKYDLSRLIFRFEIFY